ncbi:MAG TPA: hypothetical protein VF704_04275 [Allosphingosinicella sp.]|jgi:uncharacterized membrane protein
MKRAFLPLPMLAVAACQTPSQEHIHSPVRNPVYQAFGGEPFWSLAIGNDRIVLSLDGTDAVWPRTLPRTVDRVRTWQSGDGTAVISIEARPGPCVTEGQEIFEDEVRVRLSGRELTGCGGRLIGREDE